MPDISKITLPSGTSYDIKDATARSAIANIHTFDYIVCTQASDTPYGVTWDSGGTTITGTLVASDTTMYKIYLVPQDNATGDYFDEYITVNPSGTTYQWEKFGSTQIDIDNLGDLAYKDTASASYTPAGSVSAPTFAGSATTSTGTYTPAGSVSAPTVSVSSAGSTATINNPTKKTVVTDMAVADPSSTTATGELVYCSVSSETLSLKKFVETTGDSISTSNVTVKTGDATYTASTPTFTGTEATISVSGTPEGTVSQPSFTGTAATITVS